MKKIILLLLVSTSFVVSAQTKSQNKKAETIMTKSDAVAEMSLIEKKILGLESVLVDYDKEISKARVSYLMNEKGQEESKSTIQGYYDKKDLANQIIEKLKLRYKELDTKYFSL